MSRADIMKAKILGLKGNGEFNAIDFQFADLLCNIAGNAATETLYLSSMLASKITLDGRHICIDLTKHAGKNLSQCLGDIDDKNRLELENILLPKDADAWREELLRSRIAGPADAQDEKRTPLVIDSSNRLYIYRYWDYERRLAKAIVAKAAFKGIDCPEKLGRLIDEYSTWRTERDRSWKIDQWQILAVFIALRNRFSVISGGPGTGKTTIAAALVSVLLKEARSCGKNIEIAVCAPTGKAAVRIQESISGSLLPAVRQTGEIEAKTIHRLLGYIPNSPYFRHNTKNPLSADVLIVDESSMVSLPLMAKLISALKPEARLVLLGDQNQLASVESGAILADICAAVRINSFSAEFVGEFAKFAPSAPRPAPSCQASGLSDLAVSLEINHRFKGEGKEKIADVSRFVNEGDAENALSALPLHPEFQDCQEIGTTEMHHICKIPLPDKRDLKKILKKIVEKSSYSSFHHAKDIREAFDIFNEFRVLCSNRKGPFGMERINFLIMEILSEFDGANSAGRTIHCKGSPILITENDYALKLYNGDTGLVWRDDSNSSEGELRAYFPKSDQAGEFNSFPISRLPEHELAYAMTVHKAQGSGFKRVLVVLPDKHNPILSRELIYTAITRAMEEVNLMIRDEVFSLAVKSQMERSSGLQDLLIKNKTFFTPDAENLSR